MSLIEASVVAGNCLTAEAGMVPFRGHLVRNDLGERLVRKLQLHHKMKAIHQAVVCSRNKQQE